MIRPASTDDAPAIQAIYAPVVAETAISFETEPPDVAEMAGRISAVLKTWPWLVEQRDGVVTGYAYASQHRTRLAYRWSVDVTVYVAEGARRTGTGQRLYRVLLDLVRRQGFRSAFAGITLPNAGSVGLHEAMGFRPVGIYRDVGYKAGAWHDVGWWGLDLGVSGDPPGEPIPFAALSAEAIHDSLRMAG